MTTQNELLEERLQREKSVNHIVNEWDLYCQNNDIPDLHRISFRDILKRTTDFVIAIDRDITIAETLKAAVSAIEEEEEEKEYHTCAENTVHCACVGVDYNHGLKTAITAVEGVGKNSV